VVGRVVAPVSSLEDCSLAIEAGADELYCGLLTDEWKNRYGDSETVSRRQGRGAHVRSLDELAAVAAMARRKVCGCGADPQRTLHPRSRGLHCPDCGHLGGDGGQSWSSRIQV